MYTPRRTYNNQPTFCNEPDTTSIEDLIIIAKNQALNAFNYELITLEQFYEFELAVSSPE